MSSAWQWQAVRWLLPDGAWTPRSVRVAEPHQLGCHCEHESLALRPRLVELAEPDRRVSGEDGRTVARVYDDYLRSASVPRRRDESHTWQQFELTVDGDVLHAGCLDPIADRVVVQGQRVVEFPTLHVDRCAAEQMVVAAVVEVQMCVHNDVDACEVDAPLVGRTESRVEVDGQRVQFPDARVDQHPRVGVVDDMRVNRHPFALYAEVRDEHGRDGDAHAVSKVSRVAGRPKCGKIERSKLMTSATAPSRNRRPSSVRAVYSDAPGTRT